MPTQPLSPDPPLTIRDVSALWPSLKQKARDLLRRERKPGRVQTTELALSGLRRQKRESQPWSMLTWKNRSQFMAAAYTAMTRALRDKARARGRRPDRENAGNLGSEFLMPLVMDGALDLRTLLHGDDTPSPVIEAIRASLESLHEAVPEVARTIELYYWEEMGQEEIAQLTEVSDRTVRSRLRYGKALIAERLLQDFPDLDRKEIQPPCTPTRGKRKGKKGHRSK